MATILIHLNKIRARHIFGSILIALAIVIVIRPYGTVVIIAQQYGITPIAYAAILAMSGTLLVIFRTSLWVRWLITTPFVMYIAGTISFTAMSPTRPFTAMTLYSGLYIMTLYFMVREDKPQ